MFRLSGSGKPPNLEAMKPRPSYILSGRPKDAEAQVESQTLNPKAQEEEQLNKKECAMPLAIEQVEETGKGHERI